MSPITKLLTVLAVAFNASAASLVIDAFDRAEHSWAHKPNVALSITGSALEARVDFAKYRYGWFRKRCRPKPLDLRPYDGLAFRVRGGAGHRLLVHLMTDTSVRPPRTFVLSKPFALTDQAWSIRHVGWFEMALERTAEPITPNDLSHVEEVNFSVLGPQGGRTMLWLDDVRATTLPEQVKRSKLHALRLRRPIEGEAAFFAMLDYERFPALASVREARPDYAKAKAELLRYVRTRATPLYCFDPHGTDALAAAMKKLSPKWPPAVVRAADRLMTHEYTWEGETRKLTRPFDYRQKGRQWSAVLNRFSFLTHVARAWWFTHDERYAEEVVGQMSEWARSCPVPLHGTNGRVWAALEVGCRAHSWPRLYLSVLHSKSMTPEANYAILKSLAEQANFLSDPDLRMGLPNMVIVESTGLAGLAMLFPEFRNSARWLDRGLAVVDRELRERVLGDGAWQEVTPGYHTWVAHSCLGFAILAQRNKVPLPDGFEARFRSMYEWVLKIAKPNGHKPMLGDAGDSHVGPLMTEAALFFRDSELRYFARDAISPSQLEWLGADAAKQYAAIPKREPHFGSMLMPDCGLAVMRTGYQRDDSYLLFDFGPIWSHTHQDTLGFSLYAAGQTLLWDSGVCQYDLPECRKYYRQTRAHNVVLVDDADLQLSGKPRLHLWRTCGTHDLVDAGAAFENVGVTHRRQVLFIKPRIWVIRDVVRSGEPHRYTRLFHVREKAKVHIDGPAARARDGDGPTLTIQTVRPSGSRVQMGKGLLTYNHGRGPGSSNLPAPVVEILSDAQAGVADLVTVLIVQTEGRSSRMAVEDDGRLLAFQTETGDYDVALPPLVMRKLAPMKFARRAR